MNWTFTSICISGAHHKPEKCRNCMLGISVPESTDNGSNKCDTSYRCHCEFSQTPTCDIEDCELESCESLSVSLNTSPAHKTEQVNKGATVE
jgi:hypothetical protein